ncbi:MAG: hypothetical protein PHQ27_10645 [Victivallales bacterium]|nr:hypothetical protein [Victivallales bacterium]
MSRKWRLLLIMTVLAGGRLEADRAHIVMSDGVSYEGDLTIMGSRPLIIVPEAAARERFVRQRRFALADLAAIVQRPEQQEMHRPWRYREAGKTDKDYGTGRYPWVNFFTELHLVNGDICRGHIISLPLRFTGDGPGKIFLLRQIKGRVGEDWSAVRYPVRIDFLRAAVQPEPPLTGTLSGCGQLLQVTALDNRRETVISASVKDDSFCFEHLLPGTYDLFILTDRMVLYGLSDEVPPAFAGTPLVKDAKAGIDKMFPSADDFFTTRRAFQVQGNTAFAKLLVYGRRDDFYHREQLTPHGGYIWHLEVWSWHLAGREWKIDRRYLLLRRLQAGTETVRQLRQYPVLSGVKPGATINLTREDADHGGKFIGNLE